MNNMINSDENDKINVAGSRSIIAVVTVVLLNKSSLNSFNASFAIFRIE